MCTHQSCLSQGMIHETNLEPFSIHFILGNTTSLEILSCKSTYRSKTRQLVFYKAVKEYFLECLLQNISCLQCRVQLKFPNYLCYCPDSRLLSTNIDSRPHSHNSLNTEKIIRCLQEAVTYLANSQKGNQTLHNPICSTVVSYM